MLAHAQELSGQLEQLGIRPSPVEEGEEQEEEDWEDESDDEDVDMAA